MEDDNESFQKSSQQMRGRDLGLTSTKLLNTRASSKGVGNSADRFTSRITLTNSSVCPNNLRGTHESNVSNQALMQKDELDGLELKYLSNSKIPENSSNQINTSMGRWLSPKDNVFLGNDYHMMSADMIESAHRRNYRSPKPGNTGNSCRYIEDFSKDYSDCEVLSREERPSSESRANFHMNTYYHVNWKYMTGSKQRQEFNGPKLKETLQKVQEMAHRNYERCKSSEPMKNKTKTLIQIQKDQRIKLTKGPRGERGSQSRQINFTKDFLAKDEKLLQRSLSNSKGFGSQELDYSDSEVSPSNSGKRSQLAIDSRHQLDEKKSYLNNPNIEISPLDPLNGLDPYKYVISGKNENQEMSKVPLRLPPKSNTNKFGDPLNQGESRNRLQSNHIGPGNAAQQEWVKFDDEEEELQTNSRIKNGDLANVLLVIDSADSLQLNSIKENQQYPKVEKEFQKHFLQKENVPQNGIPKPPQNNDGLSIEQIIEKYSLEKERQFEAEWALNPKSDISIARNLEEGPKTPIVYEDVIDSNRELQINSGLSPLKKEPQRLQSKKKLIKLFSRKKISTHTKLKKAHVKEISNQFDIFVAIENFMSKQDREIHEPRRMWLAEKSDEQIAPTLRLIEQHLQSLNCILETVLAAGRLYCREMLSNPRDYWIIHGSLLLYRRFHKERLKVICSLKKPKSCFKLAACTIDEETLSKYRQFDQIKRIRKDLKKCQILSEHLLKDFQDFVKEKGIPNDKSLSELILDEVEMLVAKKKTDSLEEEKLYQAIDERVLRLIETYFLMSNLDCRYVKPYEECRGLIGNAAKVNKYLHQWLPVLRRRGRSRKSINP